MEKLAKESVVTNTRVYQETTLPIKRDVRPSKKSKTTRRDKSDLGDNFVAPDGGWAWLVCIAAGFSNLSIYPTLQQFGFIFREHLVNLGLTNSQITTIINTQSAISACTGLLNGSMFRRFTFRQVALFSSMLIFIGLMLTAFCRTFVSYMICFSSVVGFGMGTSISASSLAVNTYFKMKRRRAAGFSWTITGMGPIFFPVLITTMLPYYDVQGTVIIFAAISLHSAVCGLIYQPVRYHVSKLEVAEEETIPTSIRNYQCKYCELQKKKEIGLFSSQYLYQEDDIDMPGYEITEPGTPMMSRANDGWFGSKPSIASTRTRRKTISSSKDVQLDGANSRLRQVIYEDKQDSGEFFKPNHFKREYDTTLRQQYWRHLSQPESEKPWECTCAEEMALLQRSDRTENIEKELEVDEKEIESSTASVSFVQKIIVFFDLDLLRDFTFVNLVIGLTIINFGELNFSILTPFILNDFGFTTAQTTLAISILAMTDIIVRFLVPFITEKMSWDNRIFFLIGVVGIAMGRTVVACTRSFSIILSAFVWIGIGKGVRTIFWPLIIPGYIPLNRLPAASGLQLLITGLFSLAAGPFVGMIRDRYNYSVTLHCLNFLSFIAAISWTTEALLHRHFKRKRIDQKISTTI